MLDKIAYRGPDARGVHVADELGVGHLRLSILDLNARANQPLFTPDGEGLLVDLVTGTILGQHALSLTVVAYLTQRLHQRIRLFPIIQQAFTVMVLLILHQLLALWISRIIGRPGVPWYFWAPSLLGLLLWPVVFTLLRGLRHSFRVR